MPILGSLQAQFGYGRTPIPSPVTRSLQVNLTPTSYSGSGTTWDNTQNSTDGTLVNAPTFNAQRGFTLNGTTQCITLPDVTGVTDFTQANNYTIEAWVYINSTQNDTGTADNEIVEKWNSANEAAYPYVLRYNRALGNQVWFAAYNGTSNPILNMNTTTNAWHQYVGVFDHTNKLLSGYLDGVFSTSTALNIGGTISNSSTLNIGRRANNAGGGSNYLTGQIGIVRIYSVALTAAEIAQNFAANRQRFGI